MKESLNFPLFFLSLGHRSRSKADERASLLEDDDDDGDDWPGEDSAPCEGNSRSLSVGSLGRHAADAGICNDDDSVLPPWLLLDSPSPPAPFPDECGLSRFTPNNRTRFFVAVVVGLSMTGTESSTTEDGPAAVLCCSV